MADLNGKNLKFLSGTQASLDNLRTNGGAIEGAFYLTNNTHRLYIGTTEGNKVIPVPVNEGVVTVENVEKLSSISEPIVGSFYFATEENVLCTYNGEKWIQINPDTTISKIVTDVKKEENSSDITITETVTDSNSTTKTSTGYTLTPGAGITLTNNGNKITIGSSGTGGIDQTITTVQEKVAENTEAKSKYVDVNHTTVVNNPDGTQQSETTQTVRIAGGSRVESVTADAASKTITVQPTDQEIQKVDFNNESEGFTFTVTHNTTNRQVTSGTLNPTVKYGYDIDTDFTNVTETTTEQEAKFENGAADLDVFTAKQTSDLIDKRITAKLAVADAMTFCGVINSDAEIPQITKCHNGDTYKVAGALKNQDGSITNTNGTIKIGDLLVAYGTEGDEGLLTSGNFYHIPSGNEYETKTRKKDHGIEIIDDATTPTLLGGLVLEAGTQITLTDVDKSTDKNRTVQVAHADITTTTSGPAQAKDSDPTYDTTTAANETTAYGVLTDNKRTKTITVVKDITYDNGHITGISYGKEVIEDTDVALKSLTNTVEQQTVTSGTEVKITTAVADQVRATPVSDTLNLTSSTLSLTAGTKAVTMDLVWGTF